MDEFGLIDIYFKAKSLERNDVIKGIGDDAACLSIPNGMHLLVSTDTLVAEVHFLSSWSPYDIAKRAVMVNVSDIAAMGGHPAWVSLALTMPDFDELWLQQFSKGLDDALREFNIALIGGDTTRGPLSITLTIHGFVPIGKAVLRSGAKVYDKIYVSGELGAAGLAVSFLKRDDINSLDREVIEKKLINPKPRIDLSDIIQNYATSAIDISDGLSADLNHICELSNVGASLIANNIPINPLVKKHCDTLALDFVLSSGDDYELCFTVSPKDEPLFLEKLAKLKKTCYLIGTIENTKGLRVIDANGEVSQIKPRGYSHF